MVVFLNVNSNYEYLKKEYNLLLNYVTFMLCNNVRHLCDCSRLQLQHLNLFSYYYKVRIYDLNDIYLHRK